MRQREGSKGGARTTWVPPDPPPTNEILSDNSAVSEDELRETVREAEERLEEAEKRLEEVDEEITEAREHADEERPHDA